ncbi:Replicase [Acinetobacter baumannii]|uniref:replication initiation protein n=4 Tax=Gammaproteobacteria TaxID=1236 RepID=UPI000DE5F699|nr:replication initiation protein [Acinetobacter baumannii]SSI90041.1 plasmid replication protein [Acinetobacter baumannii]SSP09039.1 Replicase [Acinetobacter baumannii]
MQQLQLDFHGAFLASLPPKPYATDDFSYGVKIHSKQKAVTKKYLSLNHKYVTSWVTFDIDRPGAVADFYYDCIGVPEPNLVVENPENGHAHFLYKLQTPVYLHDSASRKPINYLNAIYSEIRELLGADKAYTGLMSKNPLHDCWKTQELKVEPYSLAGLSEHLDLEPKFVTQSKISADEAYYAGRNHKVFNDLREWAYVAVREYRGKTYQQWLDSCLQYSMALNNNLTYPLSYGEIKQIAKSISKWTWKQDAYAYAMFMERQMMKAKSGGVARSATYQPLREQAEQLYQQGMKKKEIALMLGVSDRTVRNWLN